VQQCGLLPKQTPRTQPDIKTNGSGCLKTPDTHSVLHNTRYTFIALLLRDTKNINLHLGLNILHRWIHDVISQGSFLLGMRHVTAAPSFLVSDVEAAFTDYEFDGTCAPTMHTSCGGVSPASIISMLFSVLRKIIIK
jgi:hypothetical protein